MTYLIELTNGFRGWGIAACMFVFPALLEFLRIAYDRAKENCSGVEGHTKCIKAFTQGAWLAGKDNSILHINAWHGVALVLFVGLAGIFIFLSSNFLGGYHNAFLITVMTPLWFILSAAVWGITIELSQHKCRMIVSSVAMFITMTTIALYLDGKA